MAKAEDLLVDTLLRQKIEITRKLEEVDLINQRLSNAVQETKAMTVELTHKLKSELKIAKKSLTSFSKRLPSGVMILNHRGNVVQLNPAGEKIFGIREEDVLHQPFTKIIESVAPITDSRGNTLTLSENFFDELSAYLLQKMQECCDPSKSGVCELCLEEVLPEFLHPDRETTINVHASCLDSEQMLNVSFSVLDNDPDELTDLTYVFLFRKYVPPTVK